MLVTRHLQSDPDLLHRLDPAYRHPAYDALLEACVLPLAEFGQFVTQIVYGPIVTGKRPPECDSGYVVIHQGQVAATGVDPRGATIVAPGSPWERESARLKPEDIVLPRSGDASVAKNRVAIFLGDEMPVGQVTRPVQGVAGAVVGSFVDRITLSGLDPVYALVCLKSEVVWAQIHRLVNGVGTPNISFDEVRSLRIPLASEAVQRELREAYLTRVHAGHLAWLAGDEAAGPAALREFRTLISRLNALALPDAQPTRQVPAPQ